MTIEQKALISWNRKTKRYELHINGDFMGYSLNLDGGKDTQKTHEAGYNSLVEIVTNCGYTVEIPTNKRGN